MIVDKDEIISKIGIHPLRVKNIYVFGSRVYGTYSDTSDWDIVVVGSSMNEHTEFKPSETDGLNVHLVTPDFFIKNLNRHEMHYLECIYSPEEFKNEKIDYLNSFKLNIDKLKNMSYGESFKAWKTAKSFMEDGDYYRGKKSLFHGIRILDFAIQISTHNKIVDFASSNDFWDEIKDLNFNNYYTYKEVFFDRKLELERKLSNF